MVKYRICYRLRENLYNNLFLKKFNKKKWIFLKRRFKKKKVKINFIRLKDLFRHKLYIRQKIKVLYHKLKHYQFKKIYKNVKLNSLRSNIEFSNLFFIELEKRLDISIARLFSPALKLRQIRQLILYGCISVNKQKVCSPNYVLKSGDVISFNYSLKKRFIYFYLLLLSKLKVKNVDSSLKSTNSLVPYNFIFPNHFEHNLNYFKVIFLGDSFIIDFYTNKTKTNLVTLLFS